MPDIRGFAAAIAVCLALGACASGEREAMALPPEVLDVTWQWQSFTTPVEQIEVQAPERYTIRFGSDGRAALQADCNRGMTSYTVTAERRIAFTPIALTRMACPHGSLSDRFVRTRPADRVDDLRRRTGYNRCRASESDAGRVAQAGSGVESERAVVRAIRSARGSPRGDPSVVAVEARRRRSGSA
jgi:heat shock protein HslJ